MAMLELEAQLRDTGIKAKKLYANKKLAAVCYGQKKDPVPLQMDYQEFRKLFKQVSTTSVFNLKINGKPEPVLIHEIEYDPASNSFYHVDFLRVNLKEEVDASVPVEIEGLSPAVKNFGGILSVQKQEIEVRALPADIPHDIKINVDHLENIGDSIHVSDLKLGDKVKILEEMEDVIVTVSATKEFEESNAEVPEELKDAEENKEAEKKE